MIPFISNYIRKSSSQVFIDPSCNVLEIDEIVPNQVIEHYMKNISEKEQEKYKKLFFYRIQNKIRNFLPLTDTDFFQMKNYDKDEVIILLQIANITISTLLEHIKL